MKSFLCKMNEQETCVKDLYKILNLHRPLQSFQFLTLWSLINFFFVEIFWTQYIGRIGDEKLQRNSKKFQIQVHPKKSINKSIIDHLLIRINISSVKIR